MTRPRTTVREARRLLRPLKAEIVHLAQALVRVDSVAMPPHGHETAAQKTLGTFLKPYRLDVEMYDCGFLERSRHPYVRRDRHYKGRHNLIARLPEVELDALGAVDFLPDGIPDESPAEPDARVFFDE